jgi:hypothetical protein
MTLPVRLVRDFKSFDELPGWESRGERIGWLYAAHLDLDLDA